MCSLGIEPTTFALLTQCSNHWATGTFITIIILLHFFYPPEKMCSVCLRTVDTPTDNLQCFPYIHLWRAASISTALCHQLPRDFSTIFSNFQTPLADFFHYRYILTTQANLWKKTLAFIHLEDFASTALGCAVSSLFASALSSEQQRNSTFSWP